ncbi:MAG: M20/M25/M40 family metallo-hydrolase [Chloroflexi bacterium]|nr:M20/M25/M40 family metallo-hydrolase [Chloroflexota bacterium]
MTDPSLYQRPVELAQKLIRFNTSNPPGNEGECIAFIADLLASVGIESQIYGKDPERPNLVARIAGRGQAAPLMLYGHVDVVTTTDQPWQHDPFGGQLIDGYVWGRGALDMKGEVAMFLAAFIRAHVEQASLPGDVILCILSDEEAGSEYGAGYLVEEYPNLFDGVRYALGEFGGFSFYLNGKRFYPIMVAEKQHCWMRLRVTGPARHASIPLRGGAMERLSQVLADLTTKRLPIHVTPVARLMIEALARELGGLQGLALHQLLNPTLAQALLNLLSESQRRIFEPLLRNTATPTILHSGELINVLPSEVRLELDCRLLPGMTLDEFMAELRELIGGEVEIKVGRFQPGPPEADMALYDTLASLLREADPEGIPIPLMLPGVTDGRIFSRLGIQTYGFTPLKLPPNFDFIATIHAPDERVPAEAIEFGSSVLYNALQRFK